MRYHSFILAVWQEGQPLPHAPPVWRYSLENPHTGERVGFHSVAELNRFLDQWVARPPAQTITHKENEP